METEVKIVHEDGDPGDEHRGDTLAAIRDDMVEGLRQFAAIEEKRKQASASDEEWRFHTMMAVKHLTWLHRANQFNMPINCPTGDAATCPRCIVLAELQTALNEAELAFIFVGARK